MKNGKVSFRLGGSQNKGSLNDDRIEYIDTLYDDIKELVSENKTAIVEYGDNKAWIGIKFDQLNVMKGRVLQPFFEVRCYPQYDRFALDFGTICNNKLYQRNVMIMDWDLDKDYIFKDVIEGFKKLIEQDLRRYQVRISPVYGELNEEIIL